MLDTILLAAALLLLYGLWEWLKADLRRLQAAKRESECVAQIEAMYYMDPKDFVEIVWRG